MSVQYEPVIDELSGEMSDTSDVYFMRSSGEQRKRWPRIIGIVQIIIGFLIAFLGVLECLVVPLVESKNSDDPTVRFNKSTCYGAGLAAGLVMVLTGSTAIRASVSKRKTTVYRFYNLTILTLLVYMALTLLLIIAYTEGWTTKAAFPTDSRVYQVHMFVTIFTVLGLMFALTAFVQYYDTVCCGELRLWQWWADALCGPCFRKARSRQSTESQSSIRSIPPALLI